MDATSMQYDDLELVEHFLNSVEYEDDGAEDDLATPEALARWMDRWGLLPSGYLPTASDLALTVGVREALRVLAQANNGEDIDVSDAERTLSECASLADLTIEFRDGRSILAPRATGIHLGLGTVLAHVYAAMERDEWRRFKACAKHSCRWAFVDLSRNGSRTWCSMRVCGNRVKATRYRERHAQVAAS